MGETRIWVKFRALPTSSTSQELSLLVDAGAAYTWLPRKFLEDIGVKPVRRGDTVNLFGMSKEFQCFDGFLWHLWFL